MTNTAFKNPQKLTKPRVKSITLDQFGGITASTKDKVLWDTEVTGFGLRVTRTGAKSYLFKYRLGHGRSAATKKLRIGGVDLSLDRARAKAKEWRAVVAEGGDPSKSRDEIANAPTVSQLCDDYMERHASKKRTGNDDLKKINKIIKPFLGKSRVADVNLRDIEDLQRQLEDTPYQANRVLALLSKMFSLAIKWEWRSSNPAQGIERFPEDRREVFLSAKQIETLSAALTSYVDDAARPNEAQKSVNAIRLIMLSGARKGEALSARWNQFDIEAGVWTKPSSHTKQKKEHRIPLAPAALTLLMSIRARGEHPSGYVFPAKTGSSGHLTEIKKAWAEICKRADLEGVRVHDLRHTYASILASGGLSLPIIGALLGHSQPATTARYAHLYDDPLRAATERVAAAYDVRSDDEPGGTVVGINRSR